ncbi:MAG: hypothetical protein ABFS39_17820 [Pseudomonadota bacterium]
MECGRALIESRQPEKWLDLLEELPPSLGSDGRIHLLQALAALAVGDYETVENFFTREIVIPDLREGEISLSDLWFSYHERRISEVQNITNNDTLREHVRREFPVPEKLDFRMMVEDRE